MKLHIHDTLKREKVEFVPADPKRVTMYVCGPTVYSYAHIGNARPVVVFDVLFRLLRHMAEAGVWDGGKGETEVIYARNITDVDDKINKAAIDQNVPISVITDKFETIYNADMAMLNALPPTLTPRATAHMPQMARLIEQLIARGMAYATDDGEVLFDVAAYEASGSHYGALSGRSLDDMVAGARVEVADNKKNPADFVLWKPSKPGEPEWDGPNGMKGRPGWHIECSAMIEEALGLPIDIHGGGHDLIFPHHTNEIAQSCAAHGHVHSEDYARYWMHNGFLDFSGEKMSKSVGNVKLVHDMVKEHPGEVLRLALLSAHYRGPLDWNPELITQCRARLDGLYQLLRTAKQHVGDFDYKKSQFLGVLSLKVKPIIEALCDDLNTPLALARLQDFAGLERDDYLLDLKSELEGILQSSHEFDTRTLIAIARDALVEAGAILGILQHDPEAWFKSGADDDLTAQVEGLLADRTAARAAKNWPEADRIRKALDDLGVEVMDSPSGPTWKMKVKV